MENMIASALVNFLTLSLQSYNKTKLFTTSLLKFKQTLIMPLAEDRYPRIGGVIIYPMGNFPAQIKGLPATHIIIHTSDPDRKFEDCKLLFPRKNEETDTGYQLAADITEEITIKPLERLILPTGITILAPEGIDTQIRPNSKLDNLCGVTTNTATIDPGYTGEIFITLFNQSNTPYTIRPFEKIAQVVFSYTGITQLVAFNQGYFEQHYDPLDPDNCYHHHGLFSRYDGGDDAFRETHRDSNIPTPGFKFRGEIYSRRPASYEITDLTNVDVDFLIRERDALLEEPPTPMVDLDTTHDYY